MDYEMMGNNWIQLLPTPTPASKLISCGIIIICLMNTITQIKMKKEKEKKRKGNDNILW